MRILEFSVIKDDIFTSDLRYLFVIIYFKLRWLLVEHATLITSCFFERSVINFVGHFSEGSSKCIYSNIKLASFFYRHELSLYDFTLFSIEDTTFSKSIVICARPIDRILFIAISISTYALEGLAFSQSYKLLGLFNYLFCYFVSSINFLYVKVVEPLFALNRIETENLSVS